jgi:superfamily II DNA helicase RecQ
MKTIIFKIRVAQDHLQQDQDNLNQFLSKVNVVNTSTHFVEGMVDYWSVIIFYHELDPTLEKNNVKEKKFSITSSEPLSDDEVQRLGTLKKWRAQKALELNMPQYLICHNAELISIAKMKPTQKEDLTKIKGFGDLKQMKYGDEILNLISA